MNNEEPLFISIEKGYFDIFKFLVDQGAKIFTKNNYAIKLSKRYNRHDILLYLTKYNF